MATYYWRGSTGSFNLAAGWMVADASGVLSPATTAPDAGDVVVLDNAGMTLSADCNFAGLLRLDLPVSAGSLNLNGHRISLLNTSQLGDAGSRITGPGTLETDAISAVPQLTGGGVALQLNSGATWSNAGLVMDAGIIGPGAAGGTATVVNQPGALFALATDQAGQIASTPGGGVLTFLNQGTLEKSAGTGLSSVSASVTNAGIISAASGTLELAGGGVLGGIIGGEPGEVLLAGTFALAAGTVQSVSFSTGACFGGGPDGAAVLHGPGTLASSGSVGVTAGGGDQLMLTGGAVWNNAGTVEVRSGLGFGGANNDSGTLVNLAGALLSFDADAGLDVVTPGTYALVNAGTLSKTAGGSTSRIAIPVVDGGSIAIDCGTLEIAAGGTIAGPVTGPGILALNGGVVMLGALGTVAAGGLLLNGATLEMLGGASATVSSDVGGSGGTLQIDGRGSLTLQGAVAATETIRFAGPDGTLIVEDALGFGPEAVSGFVAGDVLTVVDSAADVVARIDALETLARAGTLTSIRFTDSGTPVLSLSQAQLAADLDALSRIVSSYQIASGAAWAIDRSGPFGTAANWSGGSMPGALSDAVINFADTPTITLASGSYALHSLTNVAGDFLLSGGTLSLPLLDNHSIVAWNGGSIALNGTGTVTGLQNEANGVLTIAANGQHLSGPGGFANAGTVLVQGGTGSARIDTAFSNTGNLLLSQGTLTLGAGGASTGTISGLGGATLALAGGGFSVAGRYHVANTAIIGGTLDVTNADMVGFSAIALNAGALLLGASAVGAGGRMQQSGGVLSGSETLTAYAGAALAGGLQTGSGTTRLLGDSSLGAVALDGGRTLRNDGGLTWSAGNIMLGGGDPAALVHAGTLDNYGVLQITTGAVIGPQAGGSGLLSNAGVIVVADGIAAETDIDAQLVNQGVIQVTSGILSLNGGGSSGGQLLVADTAVLRFGT